MSNIFLLFYIQGYFIWATNIDQSFCNMYHFTSLPLSRRRFRRSIESVKHTKTRINTGV